MLIVNNRHAQFRSLSRKLMTQKANASIHLQRIDIAKEFSSDEPLQGALADYFYGCWFEIVYDNQHILTLLNNLQSKLMPYAYKFFVECVEKQSYIAQITKLATCWSVLVVPSMDIPLHKLRTSKDNTLYIVDTVINRLEQAYQQADLSAIKTIEDEFFEHCLICSDLMAFMRVWFILNRKQWLIDERWQECRIQLEQLQ